MASHQLHSWLWGQTDFSDVQLQVLRPHDQDNPSLDLLPADTCRPVTTLALHSMLLASASPGYFRPHLLRMRAGAADQAAAARSVVTTPDTLNTAPLQVVCNITAPGQQAPIQVVFNILATEEQDKLRDSHNTVCHPTTPSQASTQADGQQPTETLSSVENTCNAHVSSEAQAVLSFCASSASARAPEDDGNVGEAHAQEQAADTVIPSTSSATATATSPVVAAPSVTPPATCPSAFHGTPTLYLTLHHGEPDTVPEAVLCHVYTGKLPDDPEHIVWALWRADYLDLATTVSACAAKLQELADSKQVTMQHVALLHQLPPLQTANKEAVQSQVCDTLDSILLACLPVAADILNDPALLQHFTQLPLALIKQWVGLKSLKIDSGNTLAVLITAWHDAQPSPPTEEQCQQLAHLLPLASLSLCYVQQVLPHLQWWRAPREGEVASHTGLVQLLATLLPQNEKWLHDSWAKHSKPGQLTTTDQISHTWTVDSNQLEQLWQDKRVDLTPQHAFGYVWQPYLELVEKQQQQDGVLQQEQAGYTLGCRCALKWPDMLQTHTRGLQTNLPKAAAFVRGVMTGSLASAAPAQKGTTWSKSSNYWAGSCFGFSDVTKSAFKSLPDVRPTTDATWSLEFSWKKVSVKDIK